MVKDKQKKKKIKIKTTKAKKGKKKKKKKKDCRRAWNQTTIACVERKDHNHWTTASYN